MEEGEAGPRVSGGPRGFPDDDLLHLRVPRGCHECAKPSLTRWQGAGATGSHVRLRVKGESCWRFCLDGRDWATRCLSVAQASRKERKDSAGCPGAGLGAAEGALALHGARGLDTCSPRGWGTY